ncbi:polyphosphate kinase [Weissella oryzae SG25]|uniref:Polyphosphate kinase n=1 Tax=Weissella oryzae (strain DSM 25784 / JCM 18191 / LMG 30913 / SG25) TaxID=1329250 RepID=A0A069CRL8_WEIOS|nr:RNA degradosome polyphosphate kinase [Weissella oryzae]GAK30012.1 polyphosphate kinase [Weissella oryzae SG25]
MSEVEQSNYTNREVSWLAFNDRVLEEARDENNPLYERARFLAITQSNLDEWFQVRVASLYQLRHVKDKVDVTGLTPEEQLKVILSLAEKQIAAQYKLLKKAILPALADEKLTLLTANELSEAQKSELAAYFHTSVFPILTPMADDQTRPFPFLASESINLAVRLEKTGQGRLAIVQVPDILPRVIAIPESSGQYILLEELIKTFIDELFLGHTVKAVSAFHILRDMELDVADDDGPNMLAEVQQRLFERERGVVIRLVHEKGMTKKVVERLAAALGISQNRLYSVDGPVDLSFLADLVKFGQNPAARFIPFKEYMDDRLSVQNIFETIAEDDVLLHHPYDSFQPVLNLIQGAAADANVLAIKMTLYRVSGNSPIIKALGDAARAGKQVTALVEVKARFDEENNVHWAQELEEQGVHVIYGLKGLKVHAKATLIVRNEGDDIKRYVHLGTGNYNDTTAHFYTDLGLLTTNADIGRDVASVFNVLTGYSDPDYFNELYMSPDGIREALIERLERARLAAKRGQNVKVRFKANSLSDKLIMDELFKASADGVPLELIIRGITMLKPGLPKVSEYIAVHSIVGRFLEHSRIYIFEIDGQQEVFLSSADLMSRNLSRRIELMFPILDNDLAKRVVTIFDQLWEDNIKTRVLQSDDTWVKQNRRNTEALNAQAEFIEQSLAKSALQSEQQKLSSVRNAFEPMNRPL